MRQRPIRAGVETGANQLAWLIRAVAGIGCTEQGRAAAAAPTASAYLAPVSKASTRSFFTIRDFAAKSAGRRAGPALHPGDLAGRLSGALR